MQHAWTLSEAELGAFCRRWRIRELALFGSALREDFDPQSDLDLLVTFAPDAAWSLLDHIQMQNELAELVGRPVDLVSRRAIERSHDAFPRHEILGTARSVYVAR
jgi:predicted nucleotidyltransferase